MKYFFVCPNTACAKGVEYDEELLGKKFKCKCKKVWAMTKERVFSSEDYKGHESIADTVQNLKISHQIKCPNCQSLLEYHFEFVNKNITCPDCSESFKCSGKNIIR